MIKHTAWKLTVLISSLTLIGCSSNLTNPTTRVTGARVVQHSEQGTRVEVEIELTNPNTTPLPLIKSDYTVSTGKGQAYHATERLNRTLPSRGKQTITLPAVFTGGADTGESSYSVTGSVSYEPPGEMRKLLTESRYPLPSVSVSGSGVLSVQ